MNVYKLEIDCAVCPLSGMALVAADSYEEAVREYVENGESGGFVGVEIVFTKDSREPVAGLAYSGEKKVLCDVIIYDA